MSPRLGWYQFADTLMRLKLIICACCWLAHPAMLWGWWHIGTIHPYISIQITCSKSEWEKCTYALISTVLECNFLKTNSLGEVINRYPKRLHDTRRNPTLVFFTRCHASRTQGCHMSRFRLGVSPKKCIPPKHFQFGKLFLVLGQHYSMHISSILIWELLDLLHYGAVGMAVLTPGPPVDPGHPITTALPTMPTMVNLW